MKTDQAISSLKYISDRQEGWKTKPNSSSQSLSKIRSNKIINSNFGFEGISLNNSNQKLSSYNVIKRLYKSQKFKNGMSSNPKRQLMTSLRMITDAKHQLHKIIDPTENKEGVEANNFNEVSIRENRDRKSRQCQNLIDSELRMNYENQHLNSSNVCQLKRKNSTGFLLTNRLKSAKMKGEESYAKLSQFFFDKSIDDVSNKNCFQNFVRINSAREFKISNHKPNLLSSKEMQRRINNDSSAQEKGNEVTDKEEGTCFGEIKQSEKNEKRRGKNMSNDLLNDSSSLRKKRRKVSNEKEQKIEKTTKKMTPEKNEQKNEIFFWKNFENKLKMDFKKTSTYYLSIFSFLQSELLFKEEYWNKQNCLLFLVNEKIIGNVLERINRIKSMYGIKRMAVCEFNSSKMGVHSIDKMKLFVQYYCNTKFEMEKDKLNIFVIESKSFVSHLFQGYKDTQKDSILMKINNHLFNNCRSIVMRQVNFVKTIKFIFVIEQFMDLLFCQMNVDFRYFHESIKFVLTGDFENTAFIKNTLKKYIKETRFSSLNDNYPHLHENLKIIDRHFNKYYFSRLDYRLMSLKMADIFAHIYLKENDVVKACSIWKKSIMQNITYLYIYLEFNIKYQKMYFYLMRLDKWYIDNQNKEKGKSARPNHSDEYPQRDENYSKNQFGDEKYFDDKENTLHSPHDYFDVIEEISDYKLRTKYIKVVHLKLGSILDLKQLVRVFKNSLKYFIDFHLYKEAEISLCCLLFHFEHILLFEFYEGHDEYKNEVENQKSHKILKMIDLNILNLEFNNDMILVSLELNKFEQSMIYTIANFFIYKNSFEMMDSYDYSKYHTVLGMNKIGIEVSAEQMNIYSQRFSDLNDEYKRTIDLFEKNREIILNFHKQSRTAKLLSEIVQPFFIWLENHQTRDRNDFIEILKLLHFDLAYSLHPLPDDFIRFPYHLGRDSRRDYLVYLNYRIENLNAEMRISQETNHKKNEIQKKVLLTQQPNFQRTSQKRNGLDLKGVKYLMNYQDHWSNIEGNFEYNEPTPLKSTTFSADYSNQKFTQKSEIEYYLDISNEDAFILDLVFRMNVFVLEKDPIFSSKNNFTDVLNKFCPKAKSEIKNLIQQNMFKHKNYDCKKNLTSKLQITKVCRKLEQLREIGIKKSEKSKYSIKTIKSFIFTKIANSTQESIFFKNNKQKMETIYKNQGLNMHENKFQLSRFDDKIYQNNTVTVFRDIQAKEKTFFLSKNYKPYFYQKVFSMIKNELEKDTKQNFNLNSDSLSHSLNFDKYKHTSQNIALSRKQSQLNYSLMKNTYKCILVNKEITNQNEYRNLRNPRVQKIKSILMKKSNEVSLEKHFQSIYHEFEDDYVDPLHSIKEISKIIFNCSEHKLLKSYFFGIQFSQSKNKISFKTSFDSNKYFQTISSVVIDFDLTENLTFIYNRMIIDKLSSFYTIFPIMHDFLSRNYFKNSLFVLNNLFCQDKLSLRIVNELMKKTGLKFSLLFVKVNPSNLNAFMNVKFGLYNCTDFSFLQALLTINKYLLILIKINVRKPNGYLLKREFNYNVFCKEIFSKNSLLNIYLNEIYNEKILYLINFKSKFIQKNNVSRLSKDNPLFTCPDVQKAYLFNILSMIQNLSNRVEIQKILFPKTSHNKLIVGSKIVYLDNEYVQILFIVDFNFESLKNLTFLDERQINEFFLRIENRMDKQIENERKFSSFLILIAKRIFKFKIKILRFRNTEDQTSNFKKNKVFQEDEIKSTIKIFNHKKYISCSKMIMLYCFPEFIGNEKRQMNSKKSIKENLHLLDKTVARFFVHPFDGSTFFNIFSSVFNKIKLNDFVFKTHSKKMNTSKFVFDFCLFNERYSHLSKQLNKSILEYLEGVEDKVYLKVTSINAFPVIEELTSLKKLKNDPNKGILKLLIPKLNFPDEEMNFKKSHEKAVENSSKYSSKFLMRKSIKSIKNFPEKNKIFFEDFNRIRKEVQLSLNLYRKEINSKTFVEDFIPKPDVSSGNEIQLSFENPFDSLNQNMNKEFEFTNFNFESAKSENNRVNFNFYLGSNGAILINESIGNSEWTEELEEFYHFQGNSIKLDPKSFLKNPKTVGNIMKSISFNINSKTRIKKFMLTNLDFIGFLIILMQTDVFQKKRLLDHLVRKIELKNKKFLNYQRSVFNDKLLSSEQSFSNQVNHSMSMYKNFNRVMPSDNNLIESILSNSQFQDFPTNSIKMNLISHNNTDEFTGINRSNNFVFFCQKMTSKIQKNINCLIDLKYFIRDSNFILVNSEKDSQEIMKFDPLFLTKILTKTETDPEKRFVEFVYIRILSRILQNEDDTNKFFTSKKSLFVWNEIFFIKVIFSDCDYKYKKWSLILSSLDFSDLIFDWIFKIFQLKNNSKFSLFEFFKKFNSSCFYRDFINFLISHIRISHKSVYSEIVYVSNERHSIKKYFENQSHSSKNLKPIRNFHEDNVMTKRKKIKKKISGDNSVKNDLNLYNNNNSESVSSFNSDLGVYKTKYNNLMKNDSIKNLQNNSKKIPNQISLAKSDKSLNEKIVDDFLDEIKKEITNDCEVNESEISKPKETGDSRNEFCEKLNNNPPLNEENDYLKQSQKKSVDDCSPKEKIDYFKFPTFKLKDSINDKQNNSKNNQSNIYKNEISLLDTSTMKNRMLFLKQNNSRLLLIKHQIFKINDTFGILSLWIYKPKKKLKIFVNFPKQKKTSIFWIKLKDYKNLVNRCLNELFILLITSRNGFLSNTPPTNHEEKTKFTKFFKKLLKIGTLDYFNLDLSRISTDFSKNYSPSTHQFKSINLNEKIDKILAESEHIMDTNLLKKILRKMQLEIFNFRIQLKTNSTKRELQNKTFIQKATISKKRLSMAVKKNSKIDFNILKNLKFKESINFSNFQNLNFGILLKLFQFNFCNLIVKSLTVTNDSELCLLKLKNSSTHAFHSPLSVIVSSNQIDFDIDVHFRFIGNNPDNGNIFGLFESFSAFESMSYNLIIEIRHPDDGKWNEEVKTVNFKEMMNLFINETLFNTDIEFIEKINLYHIRRISQFVIWKMMQAGSGSLSLM